MLGDVKSGKLESVPECLWMNVGLVVNVPVPLVCLAVPLQMSEVIGSEAGPSLAQGSTGPPEEDVLGGTGEPQGSALGGVTATGKGRRGDAGEGRVNATP